MSGANGGLLVEVVGALPPPTGAATEATLTARLGTAYHATTPTKSDAALGPLEADARGNLHMSATVAHQRILALQGPVDTAWTGDAGLFEGPCDGLEASTDDVYVYAQLRESPRLASIDPADWTAGDGWTFSGTVATHAAGETADLELAVDASFPIQLGVPYAVVFEVQNRTAGTVTQKLGTAGAVARNANGQYVQILVPTVTGKVIFTPSADFDGSIDVERIWVLPPIHLPLAGVPKAVSAYRVAAVALKSAPSTKVESPATTMVRALWYRRSGAVAP